MALAVCLFYATGAVVALVLTMRPQVPGAQVGAMRMVAGLALMLAVLAVVARRWLPWWVYSAYNVLGTIAITAEIHLSHGGATAVGLAAIYVFVPLHSFFFFRWRVAMVHQLCLITANLEVSLVAKDIPPEMVIAVCATCTVAALVVGWLVRAASQAELDPLTGLLNRRGMDRAVEAAYTHAGRTGEPLVVGCLDLDHFKAVNDVAGHVAGDQLLGEVAVAWRGLLPPRAELGRYGGDEFLITLPGHDAAAAGAVIDLLRGALPVGRTCSAGFAEWDPADSASLLLRRADAALYQAKQNGRDRTYPRPGTGVSVRELRTAVAGDQFFVAYQPIVDLSDGTVVGAEALVRWRHPERGIVMPDEFIPPAEESGLIHAIGAFVLRQACRQVAQAERDGRYLAKISVNVTSHELARPGYLAQVRDALATAGLPARRLVIEITESSVATDTRNVLDTLAALRADGVAIAIDDFGTGYSSLSRLEHFPVDTVKIDRSFVRRIAEPTRLTPVIETILALADALNLSVVAEGIEEHHHAVALAARGCRQGQGWLFGRPMPLAELALPPVTTAQAAAAQAAAAQAAAMAAQPAGTAAQAAAAQRPVLVPAVPEPVTTEAAVAGSAPATG